jgi:hypothetical protein
MPVETRAAVRFREAEEESFYMMTRFVKNIQAATCTHCKDETVSLMELYDSVTATELFRPFYESLIMADLYVLAKCAEYLGVWNVYQNIRCGKEHIFAVLDTERYDVWWRQICGELDITFVHTKH